MKMRIDVIGQYVKTKKQLEKYYEDGYVIPDFQMAEKELLEIEKLHDQLIKNILSI